MDDFLLGQLIAPEPERKHQILWGYLSSIAAERSSEPMHLPPRDYAGLELSRGTICLEDAKDHVGERMKGGRIFANALAGDYLGTGDVGRRNHLRRLQRLRFSKHAGRLWSDIRGMPVNSCVLATLVERVVVRGMLW